MTILKFVVGIIASLFGLGSLIGGEVAFGVACLVVGFLFVLDGVRDRRGPAA